MGVYERFSLAGKVAVVTGGGRGIGRAIALAFAEAGADVAVMARRQADVDTVAAEIAFAGRRSLGIAGDLTLERTIPDALDRVIAELGGLHIMVNNAGGNPDGLAHPVAEMSLEKWDELLAHNMRHKFWGSNQAARRMGVARRNGSICTYYRSSAQAETTGCRGHPCPPEALRSPAMLPRRAALR